MKQTALAIGNRIDDDELLTLLYLIRFRSTNTNTDKYAYVTWAKTADALGVTVGRLRKVYNAAKDRAAVNQKPSKLLTRKKMRAEIKGRDRRKKLYPAVIDYITSTKTLEIWAGLTLAQRTVRLHQEFPDCRITASYLGKLYAKHKIKQKPVQIVKVSNPKTLRRIAAQTQEAKIQIHKWLQERAQIFWLDEAMFTCQTYRGREWSTRYTNITVAAAQFNIQSTAFLGCVSKDKAIYHYELQDRSINTDKYIAYLKRLRAKFGQGRLCIYQDNLRVHLSKLAKQAYEDLHIEVQYAPIYSPTLNPIELTFSVLKNAVKRMRLQDMVKERQRTFKELIPIAVKGVSVETVNNQIEKILCNYGLS